MLKLEILNHWIVPQQGKNPSEIDEEPIIVTQGGILRRESWSSFWDTPAHQSNFKKANDSNASIA
jgi:hypothetical protein